MTHYTDLLTNKSSDTADKVKVKPNYKMTNVTIVSAEAEWPRHPECKGKFFARGTYVHKNDDLGTEGRTSLIVKGSIEEGYVETLNSIYTFV